MFLPGFTSFGADGFARQQSSLGRGGDFVRRLAVAALLGWTCRRSLGVNRVWPLLQQDHRREKLYMGEGINAFRRGDELENGVRVSILLEA